MSHSDTLERAAGLPPLLVQIIKAALDAERFDPGNDRGGHADALVAFGQLAATAVPARGVLAPVDDVLYTAFESIAVAHLSFREAKSELSAALQAVAKFEERDPIATAVTDVKTIAEAAYFYGGLAFGITFASPGWTAFPHPAIPTHAVQERGGRGRKHRPRRRG
jgi:hypothetical protein